jgi:aspartate/methionine/tyrosine aminotransferase
MSKILDNFPNVVVISDDVYEFLAYGGEFVPFASIGDNYRKTLTCHDGGKLFNATGWTVAWGIGPTELVRPVGIVSTTVVYCTNAPGQVAMGRSFDKVDLPDYKDGHSYIGYLKH